MTSLGETVTQTTPDFIVGRTAELDQLEECLTRALRGERQIVFVTGEPGIGKTTLVDTFLAQIRSRSDLRIGYGQCIEQYGAGEAYLPLLEAINRLSQASDGGRLVDVLRQHAPMWLVQLPALVDAAERESLQRQTQGMTRERMLREMAEVLAVLSSQQGLILVLEDLHWSDVSTVELLAYLARRRESAQLCVIGTYRPSDLLVRDHPLQSIVHELSLQHQCQRISLPPLAERTVHRYLTDRFAQAQLPTDLSALVYRRTGGNPLFMVNVVEYLTSQGQLTEHYGAWRISGDLQALEQGVPDGLRQLIQKQLECLDNDSQRLLEVASVTGIEFTAAAVAAGLSEELEAIEERCEGLARKGQFVQATGIDEWPNGTITGRYRFIHTLYQNVLYEGIAPVRRARLHQRIGECKEAAYGAQMNHIDQIAGELALHFAHGRVTTKAAQYHRVAAAYALRQSAYQEALGHVSDGLALLASQPSPEAFVQDERSLQLLRGSILATLKGYAAPEVEQAYTRAHSLCQQGLSAPELFPILNGLIRFFSNRGPLSTASDLGQQLLQLAQQTQERSRLVEAYTPLGITLSIAGKFSAAHRYLSQSIALYEPSQHHPLVLLYGDDLGVMSQAVTAVNLWHLGYPDQALDHAQAALSLAQSLVHPQSLLSASVWIARLYQLCRNPQRTHEQIAAALTLATEQGFRYRLAMGTILQGWVLTDQGELQSGIASLRQGVDDFRATGALAGLACFETLLADAYRKAGQLEEGLTTITDALADLSACGDGFYEAEVYRIKGELLLAQETKNQKVEEAEQCFSTALDVARQQQAKSWELRAATSLGRLWQRQGKQGDARQLLEEVFGWFTEGFETPDLQDAERLLRELGSSVERNTVSDQNASPPFSSALPSEEPAQDDPLAFALVPPAVSVSAPSPVETLETPEQAAEAADVNPHVSRSRFHNEGEFWTVEFGGQLCRIKDSRGMHHLAHLLQHPHEEFHAVTLATGQAPSAGEDFSGKPPAGEDRDVLSSPADLGNAGAVLDPQARAAYKQRLADLQEELIEAQEFNDLGRIDQIQQEIDSLGQELAKAVGLGGRTRRTSSVAERSRVGVTKAIRTALRRIQAAHPDLGQHLSHFIHTGNFCSYTPDPQVPISWNV